MIINDLISVLHGKKINQTDEKQSQQQIEQIFKDNNIKYRREYILDGENIIDFLVGNVG